MPPHGNKLLTNPATMKARFRITFQIVTDESASHGDFAFRGFMTRDGNTPRRSGGYLPKNPAKFTLRDALEIMDRHDSGWEAREADSFPCAAPRWFTVSDWSGYMPDHGTVSLSMHLDGITPSSAARVARLAGVRLSH